MLYIRWGRGKRGDVAAFLHVDNRTHIGRFIWTCLRIDIVSVNQLAIVSIPGDRLSDIGVADGWSERSGGGENLPREELTENDNNYE